MRYCLLLVSLGLAFSQEIRLTRVAPGIQQPTDIQNAGDGSNRLFLVEQRGVIRVLTGGVVAEQPFLDLRGRTQANGECGLLGLAFPPGFAEKRYFYVNYTDVRCQTTIVARYRVSAGSNNEADAGSEEVILTQRQPYANHNAGQLAFGPDGYLYLAFGDGGSARDPQGNGQNRMTWLGKMLRIDTESEPGRYRVPSSNPFVGDARYLPEIWALGLRNPWRYSFDRETGDLWIGDVGQGRAEEIDFQPSSSRGGENYGWLPMEGFRCLLQACDPNDFTAPVHEYDTRNAGDVSVTGGYVYRGRRWPSLRGTYVYGDYGSGRIWGLQRQGSGYANRLLLESRMGVSTFGQDEQGELYVGDHRGSGIYRIDAGDAGPRLAAGGVGNAASFAAGLVAGSLGTAFGSGLRDEVGVTAAQGVPLPVVLGGVRLSINGRDVPLYAVARGNGTEQVNFQMPWDLTGASARVVVSRDGVASQALDVPVLAAQPGVFTADGTAVVVRNRDYSLATGVRSGEPVFFYATGLGEVENTPATGAASAVAPLARVRQTVAVTIDGVPCEVLFAGLAPGLIGVYQVNIVVPGGLTAGRKDLVVTVGGQRSVAVRVVVE
ncbi:MAG: PQQ-dependent sugar dehydrogenase [Bryobacterales bacterium]|nr:PQQ-dependent sugar dehydrogenase [Bryobacterales bacterium]